MEHEHFDGVSVVPTEFTNVLNGVKAFHADMERQGINITGTVTGTGNKVLSTTDDRGSIVKNKRYSVRKKYNSRTKHWWYQVLDRKKPIYDLPEGFQDLATEFTVVSNALEDANAENTLLKQKLDFETSWMHPASMPQSGTWIIATSWGTMAVVTWTETKGLVLDLSTGTYPKEAFCDAKGRWYNKNDIWKWREVEG